MLREEPSDDGVVLEGADDSPSLDREVDEATRLGIPVYFGLEEFWDATGCSPVSFGEGN